MNSYYRYDDSSYELKHYGTPRHSGRYPYGSGERPYQGESKYNNNSKMYKADTDLRRSFEVSARSAAEKTAMQVKKYRDSESKLTNYAKKHGYVDKNNGLTDLYKDIQNGKISNKKQIKEFVDLYNDCQNKKIAVNKTAREGGFFIKQLNKQVENMKRKYGNEFISDIKPDKIKVTNKDIIDSVKSMASSSAKDYNLNYYNRVSPGLFEAPFSKNNLTKEVGKRGFKGYQRTLNKLTKQAGNEKIDLRLKDGILSDSVILLKYKNGKVEPYVYSY